MNVLQSDFIELGRTIFDFIGWIFFQECPHDTSFYRYDHREEFVKWFLTLSEIRFIDHSKLNSHLHPDYLQGGTGIGETGSGSIVSGSSGNTGGILEPRELEFFTGGIGEPGGSGILCTGGIGCTSGTGGTGWVTKPTGTMHTQIFTGGVGYDYGIAVNEKYGDKYYQLFHNRTYPLIYNLGPNGKFNRSIYRYIEPSNKRFLLFHVSWDVFNDPKDDYSPEEYETRMETVEKINKGLFPLTLYYLALLFDQKPDIKDYLDETFISYLENKKVPGSYDGGKGYTQETGYVFGDSNGETPVMEHHHDSLYYRKDKFNEKFYDNNGIYSVLNYIERVIRAGDDIRHNHDDLYYTRDETDTLLYPKETIDLKIINLEQSLKDYLEGIL